jgi:hypothetical protein
MKLRIDRPANRFPSPWELYALILVAGAAVYLPLSLVMPMPPLHSPFRYLGFACPLCGGVRSVSALTMGEVALAFQYNPLAPVLLLVLLYGVISWVFVVLPFRRRLVVDSTARARMVFWVAVGLILAANWVYVVWSGMYKVPLAL